jgi:hypothetical protein
MDRQTTEHPLSTRELDPLSEAGALVPSATMTLASLRAMAISLMAKTGRRIRLLWVTDSWLVVTLLASCVTSIASLWYFFQNHQILLNYDSYSHLLIARRLFDNSTPGLAQLGGVWLPLPHLLMVPFVWNDYLWHTGLAGSIPSMLSYIVSAVYLFLAARRLTHNSRASFVGTLLFILNPNVLYLQSTPLSESVLIVTLIVAGYYFLAWAQEDRLKYLLWAAVSTFLATMARYDGWALFLVFLVLIVLIGRIKRHSRVVMESNIFAFSTLGGLGIALWFLWCEVIFGDPLYFAHSQFSSEAQQQNTLQTHMLYTYHDLWQSARAYLFASIETLGPVLFALGAIAVIVFVLQRRLSADMLAALAFLTPFPFYLVALYVGQAPLFVPWSVPVHSIHLWWNARFGAEAVAPAALFLATLANLRFWSRGQLLLQISLIMTIIGQSALISSEGIISLQDGQYDNCTPLYSSVVYLAQHYNGGRMLLDTFSTRLNGLEVQANIDFKNIIYEGSGELWNQALSNPAPIVDWIITNPKDPTDLVAQRVNVGSLAFQSQFDLVVQEPTGLSLFHRHGLPPLPTRPIALDLLIEHRLCKVDGSQYQGNDFTTLSSQASHTAYLEAVWKAGYL